MGRGDWLTQTERRRCRAGGAKLAWFDSIWLVKQHVFERERNVDGIMRNNAELLITESYTIFDPGNKFKQRGFELK